MQIIKVTAILVIMLIVRSPVISAQTAAEILQKHLDAIGGADNWSKIKTVKLVYTMPQQDADVNVVQVLDLEKGRLRNDMSTAGGKGFQIATQNGGWTYMPMGQDDPKVMTLKPPMVKGLLKQLDIKGPQFVDYKTNTTGAEYTGTFTISNVPCYAIKLNNKDGSETTAYFDMSTYYLVQSVVKFNGEDAGHPTTLFYGDYRKVSGGIVMPMSGRILTTTMGQNNEFVLKYRSVDVNVPVDDNLFIPAIPGKK